MGTSAIGYRTATRRPCSWCAQPFISGWSFVGQPIQCWFPAYYRGWWMEYSLDYCYVQNTYFVGFHEYKPENYFDINQHVIEIPKNETARTEKQIGYYQWVPFILALQAFCFFLPVVLWRGIYNMVGFRVKAICETCNIRANMDPGDRSKNVEIVARFLSSDHQLADSLGGRFRQYLQGRVVLYTYLMIKLIYAFNAVFQFLIVKWLLGTESVWWGWDVFTDLIAGREWQETGNFPRVTLCDFAVRVLGNLHRHTIQCVLMASTRLKINMFNEKIFVFLWFWFCLLAVLSTWSLMMWAFRSFSLRSDRHLIQTYLARIDPQTTRSAARKSQIHEFVKHTLRPDGMFLVRLIASNSGDLRVHECGRPATAMIFLDKFLQGPEAAVRRRRGRPAQLLLLVRWTGVVVVHLVLFLFTCIFVKPIQCWIPAQFTGAWEQYSENYCFVQNTYWLPLNYYIPTSVSERKEAEIGYYQWVPFVLGLQAILFYLPSLIWRILNWQSGISVKGHHSDQVDKRKSSVEVVATHLSDSLKIQQNLGRKNLFAPLFSRGSYLSCPVQCVLMINMFNEKVYIFVWWWCLIVFFATLGSLVYWTVMFLSRAQQESFVSQYLRVYHLLHGDRDERHALQKFVHSFLRNDGVFLLRLIATNAGDLITTDIVYQLWQTFLNEEANRMKLPPSAPSAPTPALEDIDGNYSDNEKNRLTS
ncbi:Innexin [Aphelenchoides fujianensis]|nr:Innexin [Aphelenchoides fujianensis]